MNSVILHLTDARPGYAVCGTAGNVAALLEGPFREARLATRCKRCLRLLKQRDERRAAEATPTPDLVKAYVAKVVEMVRATDALQALILDDASATVDAANHGDINDVAAVVAAVEQAAIPFALARFKVDDEAEALKLWRAAYFTSTKDAYMLFSVTRPT